MPSFGIPDLSPALEADLVSTHGAGRSALT